MSVATRNPDGAALAERLIIANDVSKLSQSERVQYYRARCQWYGLDWRLAPFDYIVTKAGLRLYLNAVGADLLRKQQKISIVDARWEFMGKLCVATVTGRTPDGREDREIGVVSTERVPPDDFQNLPMKALTKAKRRLVISMGGMGADEDEMEPAPTLVTAQVMHKEVEETAGQEVEQTVAQEGVTPPPQPAVFSHTRLTEPQQEGMYNEAVPRNVGGIMPVDAEQTPSTQTWGQVVIAITERYEALQREQRAAGEPVLRIPDFGPLRDRRVSPGKVYKAMLELPVTLPQEDESE